MADDLHEQGMKVRRQLWGDDPRQRQITERNEQNHKDFSDFVIEQLFGKIWNRPGLPIKTRSMVTMATLIALNRPNQLRSHVAGALNIGITPDEIRELILHVSLYAGVPTGVEAVAVLSDALAARK